jgi:hypothetical protein
MVTKLIRIIGRCYKTAATSAVFVAFADYARGLVRSFGQSAAPEIYGYIHAFPFPREIGTQRPKVAIEEHQKRRAADLPRATGYTTPDVVVLAPRANR